jgi:hypothetical protein
MLIVARPARYAAVGDASARTPAGYRRHPNPSSKETLMAFMRIARPPNVTADTYEKVNAELGMDGDPPEGLLLHSAGDVEGQWQIVDVWESEAQARQFYDGRLTRAIERVIGMVPPAAPSTEYELHTVVRP